MSFQQTFDSSAFNLSGLLERSGDLAAKGREIGAEMVNLSVRNLESGARAGRAMTDVRDFGDAARVQMDYLKDLMSAFSDHSARIAEIVTSGAKEAGEQARDMAGRTMTAASQTANAVAGEAGKAADKGFDAARKSGF